MSMNETQTVAEKENRFPFWKIISKNIMFIICITLLVGLVGIVYSAINVKPVYTATASVMYYEVPYHEDNYLDADDTSLGISMTKNSLKTMSEIISMPKTVQKANQLYSEAGKKGELISKNIDVYYNELSCIFFISYSDTSETSAKQKLYYLLESMEQVFEEDKLVTGTPEFISTGSDYKVDVTNRSYLFIILGVVAGLVIAVFLAIIIYLLDNKVKSSSELEELTGVGILSFISKDN